MKQDKFFYKCEIADESGRVKMTGWTVREVNVSVPIVPKKK